MTSEAIPKYRAIDPADHYVKCTCGRPNCWTRELIPLREHIVFLFRAILICGYEEQFDGIGRGDDPWPGVIYGLRMAASIEDVIANPAHVDDSQAAYWCSSAWDSDEEERESASKYAAAHITFNFVWNAYEAAIEISAGGFFQKDKIPVRGRRIFEAEPQLFTDFRLFDVSHKVARQICIRIPSLKAEIDKIEGKYNLSGAAAAAELGRIFRNYIVHGSDVGSVLASTAACARFYSITRLVLLLIQLLVLRRIGDRDRPVPLSVNQERGSQRAGFLLKNLHRHESLWIEAEYLFVDEV